MILAVCCSSVYWYMKLQEENEGEGGGALDIFFLKWNDSVDIMFPQSNHNSLKSLGR